MTHVENQYLTGERALFHESGLDIANTVFAAGESPLKHASELNLDHAVFEWKYPLWYARNVRAARTTLSQTARSGIWYAEDVSLADCVIDAPKTFRRSKRINLRNVDMPNASETLWSCEDVTLDNVSAKGDYFAMNSQRVTATNLRVSGNYAFDGARDIEIGDSQLLSKDSFWNCDNVVVRDSLIIGEYIGWNSSNLTFINCTIESLQGFCYIENLLMRGCRLINTTLAFEYSTVDAEILSPVGSIINPTSGIIRCESVGELVLDPDKVDPSLTRIQTVR